MDEGTPKINNGIEHNPNNDFIRELFRLSLLIYESDSKNINKNEEDLNKVNSEIDRLKRKLIKVLDLRKTISKRIRVLDTILEDTKNKVIEDLGG